MKKQLELKFSVDALPPPTIPATSWAEARMDYKRGPVVTEPQNAAEYFRKYIGGRAKEAFLTMYLDHRNHVLDVVLNSEGTVDHTAVYPREVLKTALELNATGLIFSHNHTAGSLEPSEGDKQLTRQIITASRALGIAVHDHLIVTQEVAGSSPVNPAIKIKAHNTKVLWAFIFSLGYLAFEINVLLQRLNNILVLRRREFNLPAFGIEGTGVILIHLNLGFFPV